MGRTENRLHPPGGCGGWGWGRGQWGEETAFTHLWRPLIREAELLRASDVCRASTLPLLVKPRIDWSSSPNVKPHRCILRLYTFHWSGFFASRFTEHQHTLLYMFHWSVFVCHSSLNIKTLLHMYHLSVICATVHWTSTYITVHASWVRYLCHSSLNIKRYCCTLCLWMHYGSVICVLVHWASNHTAISCACTHTMRSVIFVPVHWAGNHTATSCACTPTMDQMIHATIHWFKSIKIQINASFIHAFTVLAGFVFTHRVVMHIYYMLPLTTIHTQLETMLVLPVMNRKVIFTDQSLEQKAHKMFCSEQASSVHGIIIMTNGSRTQRIIMTNGSRTQRIIMTNGSCTQRIICLEQVSSVHIIIIMTNGSCTLRIICLEQVSRVHMIIIMIGSCTQRIICSEQVSGVRIIIKSTNGSCTPRIICLEQVSSGHIIIIIMNGSCTWRIVCLEQVPSVHIIIIIMIGSCAQRIICSKQASLYDCMS